MGRLRIAGVVQGQCPFVVHRAISGWWFFATPLKNDGVRQIGSSSQLLGKIKMFQPDIHIYIFCIISAKKLYHYIIKLKLYKQCETYHLLPPMSWVFKCPRCLNEADRAVKLPSLVLQKRLNGWWRLPTFKCL